MPLYRAVLRSTPRVSPRTLSSISPNPRIDSLDLSYNESSKMLTFTASVNSNKKIGHYSVMLFFKDVEPEDGLTEEEIRNGFKPKPTLGEHEIMGRCSCPNYQFRFDQANRMHDVGAGPRFRYYRRKTNRKPNNPKNFMGFCSHLIEFVNYLRENGFIL